MELSESYSQRAQFQKETMILIPKESKIPPTFFKILNDICRGLILILHGKVVSGSQKLHSMKSIAMVQYPNNGRLIAFLKETPIIE